MQSRNEAVLPFKKRPRSSEQVSELMLGTVGCFPHADLSESTASEWMTIWVSLAEKYGFARLKAAVNRLKFKLDFFPKPAEIQREIDGLIFEERDAAKANATKFVSCGKCSADGFICVNGNGDLWDGSSNEERFARECKCKADWRAERQ